MGPPAADPIARLFRAIEAVVGVAIVVGLEPSPDPLMSVRMALLSRGLLVLIAPLLVPLLVLPLVERSRIDLPVRFNEECPIPELDEPLPCAPLLDKLLSPGNVIEALCIDGDSVRVDETIPDPDPSPRPVEDDVVADGGIEILSFNVGCFLNVICPSHSQEGIGFAISISEANFSTNTDSSELMTPPRKNLVQSEDDLDDMIFTGGIPCRPSINYIHLYLKNSPIADEMFHVCNFRRQQTTRPVTLAPSRQ